VKGYKVIVFIPNNKSEEKNEKKKTQKGGAVTRRSMVTRQNDVHQE